MDPLEQLDELAPVLGAVVSQTRADQLDEPTPCAQFRVRGVLGHMIDGATAFAAGFRGDAAPAPDGVAPADPVAGFGQAMGGLAEAMHAPGALERTIAAPFGEVPGGVFARFVVLDGLVHGWDLAVATQQDTRMDPSLVEACFAVIEPQLDQLKASGAFGGEVAVAADADPQTRLLAMLGRSVSAEIARTEGE